MSPADAMSRLDPQLLALLACPACKTAVTQTEDGVLCSACGRLYPIRDGIPAMLASEARACAEERRPAGDVPVYPCDPPVPQPAEVRAAEPRPSPRVSVVMPVFNGERYLREAVASILSQTFTDFEFVIVDDGSTDGTAAVLASFQDPRVVCLRQAQNVGLMKALNAGLAAARGEYVARMDSDDVSMPDRLAKEVAYLDAHAAVGCVAAQAEMIGPDGGRLGVTSLPREPWLIDWAILLWNPFFHSTVMFRRATVLALGGYTSCFCEDYDLWVRLREVSEMVQLADVVLRYRRHSGSYTVSRAIEQERQTTAIVRRQVAKYLSDLVTDEVALAMRRTMGLCPASTAQVSIEAIDALILLQSRFCRERNLPEPKAQTIRQKVGDALAARWSETEAAWGTHALRAAISLGSPVAAELVATRFRRESRRANRLEAQVQTLQAELAEIERSRAWRLVRGWRRLHSRLRRGA